MAKKAGTSVLGKLKYAPITNQVGAYTKAQIKAYWKAEKAKKRAELDEANEKAQIAAMAKHPQLWSKPMKPRVMSKHNDIKKEKKSSKVQKHQAAGSRDQETEEEKIDTALLQLQKLSKEDETHAPPKPVPDGCCCCFQGAYACEACCAWYPTL